MRKNRENQQSFLDPDFDAIFPDAGFTTDVELTGMSRILDQIPEAVDLLAPDLEEKPGTMMGRHGITVEQLLRCVILKHLKSYSYRELARRISDSIDFRRFTRFGLGPVPNYSTLNKLIRRIRPETIDKINQQIVLKAQEIKDPAGKLIETGKTLRVDCSVVETNIAYPVDARLLVDSVRLLTRIMLFCRNDLGISGFFFANRHRRAKKRAFQIVMLKGPKAPKQRRKLYRDLLKVTEEVIAMADAALEALNNAQERCPDNEELAATIDILQHFVNLARKVVNQCRRRVIDSEKVPADDKIVSIFEEHTDIICRGKSGSPVEFGHKVMFATGKSGLVTQYEVYRGNPGDNTFLCDILEEHRSCFGSLPGKLAADRRFYSADNERKALAAGVKVVAIPKPGRLTTERRSWQKTRIFKLLQRFRAGIEGNISTLLRVFGLKRCLWKGWRAFKSYVGLGVLTYNLRKIALLCA